ncbi:MAG: VUT family protein [Acetobacterales bacterium]
MPDRPGRPAYARMPPGALIVAVLAMMGAVFASNLLVEIPINDWLTWGAFSYPVTFLVTDLTNRQFGPARARQVVYAGFALGVALSVGAADWRIGLASGAAFLVAQLLDIWIFDRLRRGRWWRAPLASSALGSSVDTAIFFSLAFAGTGLPWITWAAGDLGVKFLMAASLLVPYRLAMAMLGWAWSPRPAR